MEFRIRWFDPQRDAVQEDVVAVSDSAQLQTVLESGLLAAGGVLLSAKRERPKTAGRGASGERLDVAWWCRELRTLVQAGMTVVEALETLNAQSLGKARAEVNAVLVAKLHKGKALSVAMVEANVFSAVLIASIKASERTSSLVEALDEYLRYDDMLQKLRKQVVSAAIYPAVVVSLGFIITFVLLIFVVPRFSQMYRDLRGQVSLTTRMLVATSQAVEQNGMMVGMGLLALLALLLLAWRSGWLERVVLAIAYRIEPLQQQLDQYRKAKLYQSLALMFRGGYPLDEALAQCAKLGLGPRVNPGVGKAQAALSRGVRVSQALKEGGLTDDVSQRLLAVGERSGNFDRVLTTIGERHAGNFATFIERATRIAEPLLLLLVAVLVGGIVVMMYMPVFDVASSLN